MTEYNEAGQPLGALVPGWTDRLRPQRLTIVGRTCRLEPLDPDRHADDLFHAYLLAPDGRHWTYLGSERFTQLADYRAYAEACAATDDPLHFAIVDLATDKAIGTASFLRSDPANGSIEVGWIAYSPLIQRTVMGTEAMFLMMRYAMDDLGYRRYEWKCNSLNEPSRAAATRYGFTFEGIFRQAVVTKGRNRDTAWYSILDSEWPAVRGAFEGWLDPSNFDERGHQRASLGDLR